MKPPWLKIPLRMDFHYTQVKKTLIEEKVATVCVEARCPNRLNCWSKSGMTFMILGTICTRKCKFCAVNSGNPKQKIDFAEAERIIRVIKKLGLNQVIITSVTRDDLADGGAGHFAYVISEVRKTFFSDVKIEVLVPDFQGDLKAIRSVLDAGPDIFAHNIETVKRLTPLIRDPRAQYQRSLKILEFAAQTNPQIDIKSGFMIGLGETEEEIKETIRDLKNAGVKILTIGQYLRPAPNLVPVSKYYPPEKFQEYQDFAFKEGFKHVRAGPLIRSSYII
ncbi:MAG: lipoyl synthase [candidate division WOR-3 bacterium]|nr:lipoyl synthase [candidate division WOR-3 bacterium]MCX7757940.1 lipoyl synthase [candidate division WOR-3 bacterium]MDW7987288.1 lipoyl synthase [candidate division WOR-3 bacterium]